MLEQLFPLERSRQRLLLGPMGPYIEALVARLSEMGYAEGYTKSLVRLANSLGEWLEDHGKSPIEAGKAEIEAYIATQSRNAAGRLPDWVRGIRRLPIIMAPFGVLCHPDPPTFADPILGRFAAYLKNAVGVTPHTVKSYCTYLRPLVLGVCHNGPPQWSQVDAAYVAAFVLKYAARPNATRPRIVSATRTFLRFLVAEREVPPSLLRAIPNIRRPWESGIPRFLSAEELDRVLQACQSEDNGSIRDRAFIALLARLGVRSGELRHLVLEDIDWSAGVMHIQKSKSGLGRTLPIPADAGALLAEYLQSGRPKSASREVFLSAHPPHNRFHAATASSLVHAFLKRIGLDHLGRGSHCFRHTAATHMVRNGADLKDVADVLGHRSIRSTQIYVKVDEPSLKQVALPWMGGDV